ncbi:MAG TPA: hypothetical protein PLR06_02130 [Cyclobacteriaceae bacterium]|nr:hypothetical protein [Cyclobacteriaceae bacterium]
MKTIAVSVLLVYTMTLLSFAEKKNPPDSGQSTAIRKSVNMRLTSRFHSMGQFAYGGRIVSDNPVVDFNFNYDRKNWGLQIFKAFDIKDFQTPINFTLAVVNKNFRLGNRLTITPSVGFILEQNNSIADHGSDVAMILTTTYKLSKAWTLDYSALFGNLVLVPEEKDWVNRIKLTYSRRHLDLFATGWHNNKVLDAAEYVTFGLSAFMSRMKLADGVLVNVGISGLIMPYSNQPEEYPKKNGVIFTIAVILD